MAKVGAIINGVDTLTQYGLCMLADLTISEPVVKESLVDLPGADGTLDYSEALTGYPVFEDRTVSFTLFKMMDEEERAQIRTDLLGRYGGRIVTLVTPDLPTYYWRGRFTIGGLSDFNSGRIPISARVEPYRLKAAQTTVTESLSANTEKTITLVNAGMPTIPTIRCTEQCTVTVDGVAYTIPANTDYRNDSLMITGLSTQITALAASSASLTITYQEGVL